MAYNISYYSAAKADIKEAKDWYKKERPGLEKLFAVEVKSCIKRLQENPQRCEIKHGNVRTAFTEIFLYSVHFYINDTGQQIVIIAITHQKRNPELSHHPADN